MMILKSRAVSASSSAASKKKEDGVEFVLDERFMFRLEEGCVPKQLLAEFRSVPKLKQNKKKSLKLGVIESVKLDLDQSSVVENQKLNIMNEEDEIFGTAHITSWQSQLRRTEGCKEKFTSKVFLRDHACSNRTKSDPPAKKRKKKRMTGRFLI